MLFRTTEAFLRTFGLSGLEELPALPALEENEQMELELEESAEQPPAQMITLTPPVPQTFGGEDTQPPDAPQETE